MRTRTTLGCRSFAGVGTLVGGLTTSALAEEKKPEPFTPAPPCSPGPRTPAGGLAVGRGLEPERVANCVALEMVEQRLKGRWAGADGEVSGQDRSSEHVSHGLPPGSDSPRPVKREWLRAVDRGGDIG
jgi:hypothetical protein